MIEKIKKLPQTMETLKDLFDLAVQCEDKATRIETSQWVRKHCIQIHTAEALDLVYPVRTGHKKFYFIDDAHRSKEYRAFMNEVTLLVQTDKNKHDDACDSLAMQVEFLDNRGRVVTVMRRPF